MSRHLILLETHLPPPLQAALNHLVDEANAAGRSLYVTGSTMRDVIAGIQARELEVVVEGERAKFGAGVTSELPVHVCTAAVEQPAAKPGLKPKLMPASIHEYLRHKAFSVDAIALSVGKASRGLLIDPTNGVADIEAKELRTLSNQTFLAKPVQMLELLRLKVRLGFSVYPRTQSQFENAFEAGAHKKIRHAELRTELERVASEPKAPEVLQAWEAAGLLADLLPEISGEALNTQGFAKVQKVQQTVPYGVPFAVDQAALFFTVLTASLSPKQRTAFLATAGIDSDTEWMKLPRRVAKAEKELASSAVTRPSHIYDVLQKAGGTVTLLLALRSTQRVVQDRIRNYLTKYLPTAQQARPGESIAKLLDARPKRVLPPPEDSAAISVTGGAEAQQGNTGKNHR